MRELAKVFQDGKTQIQRNLNNEHGILKQSEDNDPGKHKRKIRKTGNREINKLTWDGLKMLQLASLPPVYCCVKKEP